MERSGRVISAETEACQFTETADAGQILLMGTSKIAGMPNRDVDSENTYESKGEQTRIIRRRFLGNRRMVAIFRALCPTRNNFLR